MDIQLNTQLEAIRYFQSPKNCHDYMVKLRWNGKVTCFHCGSDKVGKFSGKRMVSNCKSCKKQFTVKLGTIFEDSKIGLDKWLPAFWLILNAKNGTSSCELARSLGVTQKTAWFIGHRIRLAIQQGTIHKFKGEVESDETLIGGRISNMHESTKKKRGKVGQSGMAGKSIIQGILERRPRKGSRIAAYVVQNAKMNHIQGNVVRHVKLGSKLYTDSSTAYSGLSPHFAHEFVDHTTTYVNGRVHTNGLENFWSLLKRSIKGTYICPRHFHLHRYLDEQVYRFNDRKLTDGERFLKGVNSVVGKRLTYHHLIGKAA